MKGRFIPRRKDRSILTLTICWLVSGAIAGALYLSDGDRRAVQQATEDFLKSYSSLAKGWGEALSKLKSALDQESQASPQFDNNVENSVNNFLLDVSAAYSSFDLEGLFGRDVRKLPSYVAGRLTDIQEQVERERMMVEEFRLKDDTTKIESFNQFFDQLVAQRRIYAEKVGTFSRAVILYGYEIRVVDKGEDMTLSEEEKAVLLKNTAQLLGTAN